MDDLLKFFREHSIFFWRPGHLNPMTLFLSPNNECLYPAEVKNSYKLGLKNLQYANLFAFLVVISEKEQKKCKVQLAL